MSKRTSIRLLVAVMACLCVMNAAAETIFSSMDLGTDSELLFTAETSDSSLCNYQSLYLATLSSGGDQAAVSSPRILTCFPQQMNVYGNGSLLEVRNNAGTAMYDTALGTLTWTEGATLAFKTQRTSSAFMEPVSVSPDGNWKCVFEKTTAVTANVYLEHIADGKRLLLSADAEYRYDTVPVLWSPDSSVILYEKGGMLYFLKTADAFSTASLTEEFRTIGKGNISNVRWANNRTIVFINYDMVYEVAVNELQTRALYSDFLGLDTIAGRLPCPFDSEKDVFWVNEDVTALVVVQNNRTLWYLELSGTDFNYVSNIQSFPLMNVPGAAVSFDVFWTPSANHVQYPVVWIEVFRSGERVSYAYKLARHADDGSCSFTALRMPAQVSDPCLSPDGTKLAFKSDMMLHVYAIDTWLQTDVFFGEKIIAYVWRNNSALFVGGNETVREWNIVNDTDRILFLSSVDRFGWNLKGDVILGKNKSGTFTFDRDTNVWNGTTTEMQRGVSVQNDKWRVFFSESKSDVFANGIYVRTLSGLTETRPLVSDYTVQGNSVPEVALVFDALDNADGLTKILDTLGKSGVKATFFINGEFIRRYPDAVKEIEKAGHQCASMFFTTGDLTSLAFVADESYIRRGLARNEDEFFNLTGKELSLYWHAPYYSVTPSILESGKKAGYVYVDRSMELYDTTTIDGYVHDDVTYWPTRQIISMITGSLTDGAIIPVSVGVSAGKRSDYLYDRLDVLISAIQESGYRFVTVSEL